MVHKGLKFCVALDSPGPSAYQDYLWSQFHLSAFPIAQKVPSRTLVNTYYLPQLQFTAGTLTSTIDLFNSLPIYCRQTSNFRGLAINGFQHQQLAHSLLPDDVTSSSFPIESLNRRGETRNISAKSNEVGIVDSSDILQCFPVTNYMTWLIVGDSQWGPPGAYGSQPHTNITYCRQRLKWANDNQKEENISPPGMSVSAQSFTLV